MLMKFQPSLLVTRFLLLILIVASQLMLSGIALGQSARSEASDVPRPGVVRTPLQLSEVEGRPIARVFYDLKGSAGITGGDATARTRVESAFGIKAGSPFGSQLTSIGLMQVQRLSFVRKAHIQVYESERPGYIVLVLSVELGTRDGATATKGAFGGQPSDFPILFQNEHAKVLALIDGGFGSFTDFDSWFGSSETFGSRSPIALDPADGGTDSWFETYVEYGLAGITQLGNSPFWTYGAVSWLTSFSAGPDLFRSDSRDRTEFELGYGGVVFQIPDTEWVINASAGRQSWQLNDGFLFSEFSGAANAGPYPGLYLNPRTAFEMTGLLRARHRNTRIEAFYIDPAEIDFLDSDTTFAGINVAQRFANDWEASLAYFESPESNTKFSTDQIETIHREGQQTFNARLASTSFLGVKGLEAGAEGAYQTHRDIDWDAWAYYGRIGYSFASLPWSPNLRYRYASFSGDDPATATYERFDAPLSSGLDTWVQGIVAKKVVSNSNLDSHRIRLNLAPAPRLSLTFDYFWLWANETAGGSRNYAQEADFAVRWSINRNLFFLGVAGIAVPDDRLEEQAGSDLDAWSTLQASLFWAF